MNHYIENLLFAKRLWKIVYSCNFVHIPYLKHVSACRVLWVILMDVKQLFPKAEITVFSQFHMCKGQSWLEKPLPVGVFLFACVCLVKLGMKIDSWSKTSYFECFLLILNPAIKMYSNYGYQHAIPWIISFEIENRKF